MSTLINLKRQKPLRLEYRELDPRQIVDWKSSEENLNSYGDVIHRHRSSFLGDPFEVLADIYPAEALAEMEAHYARSWEAALRMSVEFGLYRVVGNRAYRGHAPGEEFEARLDQNAAARAVMRGDIELLRRIAPGLAPGSYTFPDGWLDQPQSRPPRRREAPLSLEEGT